MRRPLAPEALCPGLLVALVRLSLWMAGIGGLKLGGFRTGLTPRLLMGMGAFPTGRWRPCPRGRRFSEVIEDSHGERLCGRYWLVELGRGTSL